MPIQLEIKNESQTSLTKVIAITLSEISDIITVPKAEETQI